MELIIVAAAAAITGWWLHRRQSQIHAETVKRINERFDRAMRK